MEGDGDNLHHFTAQEFEAKQHAKQIAMEKAEEERLKARGHVYQEYMATQEHKQNIKELAERAHLKEFAHEREVYMKSQEDKEKALDEADKAHLDAFARERAAYLAAIAAKRKHFEESDQAHLQALSRELELYLTEIEGKRKKIEQEHQAHLEAFAQERKLYLAAVEEHRKLIEDADHAHLEHFAQEKQKYLANIEAERSEMEKRSQAHLEEYAREREHYLALIESKRKHLEEHEQSHLEALKCEREKYFASVETERKHVEEEDVSHLEALAKQKEDYLSKIEEKRQHIEKNDKAHLVAFAHEREAYLEAIENKRKHIEEADRAHLQAFASERKAYMAAIEARRNSIYFAQNHYHYVDESTEEQIQQLRSDHKKANDEHVEAQLQEREAYLRALEERRKTLEELGRDHLAAQAKERQAYLAKIASRRYGFDEVDRAQSQHERASNVSGINNKRNLAEDKNAVHLKIALAEEPEQYKNAIAEQVKNLKAAEETYLEAVRHDHEYSRTNLLPSSPRAMEQAALYKDHFSELNSRPTEPNISFERLREQEILYHDHMSDTEADDKPDEFLSRSLSEANKEERAKKHEEYFFKDHFEELSKPAEEVQVSFERHREQEMLYHDHLSDTETDQSESKTANVKVDTAVNLESINKDHFDALEAPLKEEDLSFDQLREQELLYHDHFNDTDESFRPDDPLSTSLDETARAERMKLRNKFLKDHLTNDDSFFKSVSHAQLSDSEYETADELFYPANDKESTRIGTDDDFDRDSLDKDVFSPIEKSYIETTIEREEIKAKAETDHLAYLSHPEISDSKERDRLEAHAKNQQKQLETLFKHEIAASEAEEAKLRAKKEGKLEHLMTELRLEQEAALPKPVMCITCKESPRDVRFNCTHIACCQKCALNMIECPFCRVKITKTEYAF